MKSSVNTKKMKDSSDYLKSVHKKMKNSLCEIENSCSRIKTAIKTLKNYNGACASGTLLEKKKVNGKEVTKKYVKTWNVSVTGDSYEVDFSQFNDKNDMLLKFSNDIDVIADKMDDYIDKIITILLGFDHKSSYYSYLIDYDFGTEFNAAFQDYSEIIGDKYTIQGITTVGDQKWISAHGGKNDKGRIYVYDKNGNLISKIILPNNTHAGGISYDEEHGVVYVCDKGGKVRGYRYEELSKHIGKNVRTLDLGKVDKDSISFNINTIENDPDYVSNGNVNIKNITKKGSAATVYYHDNKLYVATHDGLDDGQLVVYDLKYTKNGAVTAKPKVMNIGSRVQGVAVTEYKGKKYLTTTSSMGASNSSITMYEMDDKGLNQIGKKEVNHSGLEGISIDKSNNVTLSYENFTNDKVINSLKSTNDYVQGRNTSYVESTSFEKIYKDLTSSNAVSTTNKISSAIAGGIYEKDIGGTIGALKDIVTGNDDYSSGGGGSHGF